MVFIPVYKVDSLNKPGQIRKTIREFEIVASEIPADLARPLFLAWRGEERARNGDLLTSFTTFAKFTKEYTDELINAFVEMSQGSPLSNYTQVAGSDPVYRVSRSGRNNDEGIWRITHMALIDPNVPSEEREIDEPFKEVIKHVPTYTNQVSNNGFFNGSFSRLVLEPEKLDEEAKRKKGIKLLLDVVKEPTLQKAFYEDLQIPLISSYCMGPTIDKIEEREYREKKCEEYEKRLIKWEENPDENKKPTIPKFYPLCSYEAWFNALTPTEQNQIREYCDIRSESKYNTKTKSSEMVFRGNIMETPCVLYTLEKCGISKEIIEEIKNSGKIYGNTIKIKPLVEILSKHKIQLIIYSLKKGEKINSNPHYHPSKIDGSWTIIKVDRYENHMFQRKSYFSPSAGKEVSVLLAIAYGFKYGLLRKLNAFEFYTNFRNCSLDPIPRFGLAKFWKELDTKDEEIPIENEVEEDEEEIPIESETEEDEEKIRGFPAEGCRKLRKPKDVEIPDKVYYGDFETTTNEDHHIPYMVHCIGPDIDKTYIGEDCAVQMLCEINEKRGIKLVDEHNIPQTIRLYFHNLKYDATFVEPHLTNINPCEKGTTKYSIDGEFFDIKSKKRSKIQIWDTLPILRCKISKAAEFYIGGERAKSFQKEACPYAFYTRENFERFPDYWAPISEFEGGFNTEKDLELFHRILPKLDESIYNEEKGLINYMEYSAFYCRQDVVIMKEAFENVRKLFLGEEEIEGIHGKPPFKLDILKYRTISSIGWNYFVNKTFGKLFEEHITANGKKISKNNCPIYEYSKIIRTMLRLAARGGRTMMQYNEKYHYISPNPEDCNFDIVDYDAVSLYPSAGARAWIPRGEPHLIKPEEGRVWTQKEFLKWFEDPDSREITKKYCDGVLYVTKLHANKKRAFPLICVKNEENLNNYSNFVHEKVCTMISMIDLFNFIELQDGEFEWEGALVWNQGEYPPKDKEDPPCGRDYRCQKVFKKLHVFRSNNHNLKDEKGNLLPDHPIANLSKLVSNSIYGKTNQKMQNFDIVVVDIMKRRKRKGVYEEYNYWQEFFNANAYRMIDFQPLADGKHIKARVYKSDTSYALVPFAINILAMSKRIIGRVITLAEDAAQTLGVPGPFYTDTDSVHLLRITLPLLRQKFYEKFGYELEGKDLGQFHIDFDIPANFHKAKRDENGHIIDHHDEDERVRGAIESIFGAKKIYADKLVGSQGTIGFHMRMKGICSDLVKWEDYEKFYNDEPITYDLALGVGPRFEYDKGQVYTKLSMKRTVMSRECRKKLKMKENPPPIEDVINDTVEQSDVVLLDHSSDTPELGEERAPLYIPYTDPEWAEWMEGDTQPLDIIEDEETQMGPKRPREDDQINIETDDEEPILKIAKIDD